MDQVAEGELVQERARARSFWYDLNECIDVENNKVVLFRRGGGAKSDDDYDLLVNFHRIHDARHIFGVR